MRITHIRLRKLVSHEHRYGHDAVELEAALAEGEDVRAAADALRAEIDAQLRQGREREDLRKLLDELRHDVVEQERKLDTIKAAIEAGRAVLREHQDLAALARERGLDAGFQLGGKGLL